MKEKKKYYKCIPDDFVAKEVEKRIDGRVHVAHPPNHVGELLGQYVRIELSQRVAYIIICLLQLSSVVWFWSLG